MKRLYLAVCLILSAFTGIGEACAAASEPQIALVIGNAAYRNAPPLKNPINDARDMAKALQELGFDVIRVENANKQQLEHAIGQFSAKLAAGSVGLFFYSGHGMQANGHNFLVPVDAELASEALMRLETVDIDVVLELMDMAKTRINLVILDACRSNPFERRFRALSRGLAPVDQAPRGTLVAYSTAPGKVASDGDGANGLYTAELLKAIREPGLTVEQVFKKVRIAVSTGSNDNQMPWETSSLTGDFFFKPTGTVAAGPRPAPTPPAQSGAAPRVPQSPAVATLPTPQTARLTPPAAPVTSADEIAFRCPAPGTVVQYDTGATLTFASENGLRCAYTDQGGRSAEKFAAFSDELKALDAGLGNLWPMKVGNERMVTMTVGGYYLAGRYTVLRRESITVPAGSFDTFVVALQEQGRIPMTSMGVFVAERFFWYAPDLGVVVKSKVAISQSPRMGTGGAATGGDYQATRIVAPGGVSAQ